MEANDTPRTERFLHHIDDSEIDMGQVGDFMRDIERELAAATADRDALRLRVAQLEGVGDMWRAAELALTKAERDLDGYAQQVQRLADELRQAMRGAQ